MGTFNMQASALFFVIMLCFASNSKNMVRVVDAVWMTLPSSGTKCIMEEIKNNAVVLGDYYAMGIYDENGDNTPILISLKVTDPFGETLHHREDVQSGQFAFTTSIAGEYTACFWVDEKHKRNDSITLHLDWKTGIATKDWDAVAKKEKIEGVELELVKLTGLVKQISENLLNLMEREYIMRTVSDKTNAKLVWFSIVSLGICIVTSVFQLWYLKRYFRKKKLI